MKKISAIIILLVATLSLNAQNNLNKQVDVTRAYEPTIGTFPKINIEPNMVDTVQLRPEFNYNINSHPLTYSFGASAIKPVSFNTIDDKTMLPFYLKVGAGFPLQSVLDAYATKSYTNGKLGAYINHTGQYSKIKNDQLVKAPATNTFNSIGVWGERNLYGRLLVGGEVGYDYDKVTRYGYFNNFLPLPQSFDSTSSGLAQTFNNIRGKVYFGNSFQDMSQFNFRVNADVDYLKDKYDFGQMLFNGGVELGQIFNNGGFRFGANFIAASGLDQLKPYKDNVLKAGGAYLFDNGDIRFSLGVDFGFCLSDSINTKGHFYPTFTFEKEFMGGALVPFVDINGKLTQNNYLSLIRNNPYLAQGTIAPNTSEYNGRIGIKGALSPSVKYKLFGGYTVTEDMLMYTNLYNSNSIGNLFGIVTDKAKIWTAGLELEANIMNALDMYVKAQVYSYDLDSLEKASGMPSFDMGLGLKYSHRNKLFLNLGANIIGERHFYSVYEDNQVAYNKVSPQVNLCLGADYFISKNFGIFLNLENLLNQKIYQFNHYPSVGINGQIGVKVSF